MWVKHVPNSTLFESLIFGLTIGGGVRLLASEFYRNTFEPGNSRGQILQPGKKVGELSEPA